MIQETIQAYVNEEVARKIKMTKEERIKEENDINAVIFVWLSIIVCVAAAMFYNSCIEELHFINTLRLSLKIFFWVWLSLFALSIPPLLVICLMKCYNRRGI